MLLEISIPPIKKLNIPSRSETYLISVVFELIFWWKASPDTGSMWFPLTPAPPGQKIPDLNSSTTQDGAIIELLYPSGNPGPFGSFELA